MGEGSAGVLLVLYGLDMLGLGARILSLWCRVLLAGCYSWIVVILLQRDGLAVVLVLRRHAGVGLCVGGSCCALFVPG